MQQVGIAHTIQYCESDFVKARLPMTRSNHGGADSSVVRPIVDRKPLPRFDAVLLENVVVVIQLLNW